MIGDIMHNFHSSKFIFLLYVGTFSYRSLEFLLVILQVRHVQLIVQGVIM